MTSSIWHPIGPGGVFMPGFAGMTMSIILSPMGAGGITEGTTNLTFHICDAETILNKNIEITQEIIDTKIINFNDFPISIFGVVKEHIEKNIGDMGIPEVKNNYMSTYPTAIIEQTGENTYDAKFGLKFTSDQIENIGKYNAGQYEGGMVLKINGSTNRYGQFGWLGTPYVDINDVIFNDQKNLFKGILYDYRKLWFRGDNPFAWGRRDYPFESDSQNDITNNNIFLIFI